MGEVYVISSCGVAVTKLEMASTFMPKFPNLYLCSEQLHLQSYLEMLWSETGYFGLLGNNHILFIILLHLIKG